MPATVEILPQLGVDKARFDGEIKKSAELVKAPKDGEAGQYHFLECEEIKVFDENNKVLELQKNFTGSVRVTSDHGISIMEGKWIKD
ncbi:hypothetical protein NLG97_g291 [Lecanicillium saksenae]|uniref:Uncharacterized protein n=1 Tax=Lecanicillium saksenae TaxID=468837 RepID=A0ACC1R6Y9_9HYPO|nr:hypothetical protein NLG97_g291 [Lecanicillium saksenae]